MCRLLSSVVVVSQGRKAEHETAPGNTPVQRRPAKLAPKSEFAAKPPPEKDAEVGGNTESEHPAGYLGPWGPPPSSSTRRLQSKIPLSVPARLVGPGVSPSAGTVSTLVMGRSSAPRATKKLVHGWPHGLFLLTRCVVHCSSLFARTDFFCLLFSRMIVMPTPSLRLAGISR